MLTSSEIAKMKKKELQEACVKLLRKCKRLQRENRDLKAEVEVLERPILPNPLDDISERW